MPAPGHGPATTIGEERAIEIDGRQLTCRGPVVERLQQLYTERVERDVAEQRRP